MDITTFAAAKAYTDKKVAEGGGSGGGVKVIDLNDSRYNSIGESIFMKIMSTTGVTVENHTDTETTTAISNLFSDIEANETVKLQLSYYTFKIEVNGITKQYQNNELWQVAFNAEMDGAGTLYEIHVMFSVAQKNGNRVLDVNIITNIKTSSHTVNEA